MVVHQCFSHAPLPRNHVMCVFGSALPYYIMSPPPNPPQASAHERLLKDFSCSLCKGVLQQPLSMPCGHNFCKGCLDRRYAEAEAAQNQGSKALTDAKPARSLRVRKVREICWYDIKWPVAAEGRLATRLARMHLVGATFPLFPWLERGEWGS